MTILLVEDHAAAAEALGAWLSAIGHRVAICRTGRAALRTLEREVPDLALIDLGLPDISGVIVAARLREVAGTKARCFAVTGRPFLEPASARLFDGIFEKPLNVEALRRVLRTCDTFEFEARPSPLV